MFLGVALAVSAGLMWAGIAALFSHVARHGKDHVAVLGLSSLISVAATWILVPDYSKLLAGDATRIADLAIVMALGGLFVGLGMTILPAAMRMGHHGATWTIGQASLIVPAVVGLLVWGDRPAPHNLVGVAIVMVSLVCLGIAKGARSDPKKNAPREKRSPALWFTMSILAFCLLGLEQTAKTMPSTWPDWEDTARLRPPLALTASMIVYQVIALAQRRYRRPLPIREALILPVLVVPSHFIIYGAVDLFDEAGRAGLGYPTAVSTCIVSFALYSVFVLREPLTRWRAAGLVLCAAGIIMVAFKPKNAPDVHAPQADSSHVAIAAETGYTH
jgi:uncharacterized membrane protein